MPKVKRVCKHCGKVDYVFPCRLKRPYCSHACYVADRKVWIHGRTVWTDDELSVLREQYPTSDLVELAQTLDRTEKAIHAKAETLGIRRQGINEITSPTGERKYIRHRVDVRFFDTWSPAMAYILGFFLADGCVDPKGLLKVTTADLPVIQFIKSEMRAEHPIQECVYRLSTKPLYELLIRRKYLSSSLAQHGMHPRKSYDAEWPDSPSEMFPHLLRGYFDGDGYVYHHDGSQYSLRLEVCFTSASLQLFKQLKAKLAQHGIRSRIRERKRYPGNYRLRLGSRASAQLYDLMYPDPDCFCLQRKRQVFETYLQSDDRRSVS